MIAAVSLTVFLLIFLYTFHRYVIKPYLSMKYYRNKGFTAHYFYPLFGYVKLWVQGIEKFHDFNHFRISLMLEHPNTRGMITNFIDQPCLVLCDTKLKKDYFVNKFLLYEKPYEIVSFFKDSDEAQDILFGEGEKWRRARRFISQIFHHDFMASNIGLVSTTTDEIFSKIQDLSKTNLMDEFQTITGNVILTSLLGKDFHERQYKGAPAPVVLADLASKIAGGRVSLKGVLFGKTLLKFLNPQLKRNLEAQRDFRVNFMGKYVLEKYEEYHKKLVKNPNYKPESFLESSFALVDKKEEEFTLKDVTANINMIFLAGTDTTGHLVAHIIIYLSKYPEIKQKLLQELETIDSDIKGAEDYEKIKNLSYLTAVIKETLRVASPAPDVMLRRAIKDHNLGDLMIRKGTFIFLGIPCNNFDPHTFRNPEEYIPERWVKGHELYDNAEEKDPYGFIPFSAGARNCIGQHLANIEARIILVKFLKKFEVKLKMKEPIDWIMGFVKQPKQAAIAELKERK